MSRDWNDHKQRRKVWDRGLSPKALSTYEPRVAAKVERLVEQLKLRSTVDVTTWTMLLTFDVMGEIGFGKDFGGLETGHEHPAIKAIHNHMKFLSITVTVPWLLNLLSRIPGATAGYAPLFKWCMNEVKTKQQKFDADKPLQDVASHLIRAYVTHDPSASPSPAALQDDSRLLIIAGSDTTATTLAAALYFLASHRPTIQSKLRSLLDSAMPTREWSLTASKSVTYLEDIIYETLRLKPAVMTGVYRVTPENGIIVDGVHIPGNTNVIVPIQQIQTDPRYWTRADEFIPERWSDKKMQWETDQQPWIPFNIGPYNCPGKSLAISTMRIALSMICLSFEVEFAEGETGREFDEEAKDVFTTSLRPLRLTFRARK
ncbi:MAG: hypothetical protein Q9227_004924 [Pyrenula ochraceoflavens]